MRQVNVQSTALTPGAKPQYTTSSMRPMPLPGHTTATIKPSGGQVAMGMPTAGGLIAARPPPNYGAASAGSAPPSFESSQGGSGGYSQAGSYRGNPATGGQTAGQHISGMGDFNQFRDNYQQQYDRRLNPQIEAQDRQFQQQMVAQGIQPGTQAYNDAYANISRGQNDARIQGHLGASQAALQAQGQFAGQDIAREGHANQLNIANIGADASRYGANAAASASRYGADLRNSLGQQQLTENGRQFNINDLFRTNQLNEGARQFDATDVFRNQQLDQNGLLGMGNLFLGFGAQDLQRQGLQLDANGQWFGQGQGMLGQAPGNSFTPTGGLVENTVGAGQSIANANAQRAAGFGSLLGGGMSALFSDKRLKKNIKYLGTENGINIYEYEYKNKEMGIGKQIGVMAQEIMHKFPNAVKKVKGMFKVDYSKLVKA